MISLPLWSVPTNNARLLHISTYIAASGLTIITIPLFSMIIAFFLSSLDTTFPTLFKDQWLIDFFETLIFSILISWLGFLIALPFALIARHFGLIGILPVLLFIFFACLILAMSKNDYKNAETAYQIFTIHFFDALFLFKYASIFAIFFWLILVSMRPKAFEKVHLMIDFIRKPTQSELPTLAQLWNEGWQTAHAAHVPASLTAIRTLDSFEKRLAADMDAIRVIGDEGAPLGLCMIKGNEIYQIFVAPEAKGTGAAKTLMGDGLDRIRAAGHETATLDVIPENTRAITFYEKVGWQRDEIRTVMLDTLDDPYPLPCLIMTKVL